jgi:hypothetical protein
MTATWIEALKGEGYRVGTTPRGWWRFCWCGVDKYSDISLTEGDAWQDARKHRNQRNAHLIESGDIVPL